MMNIKRIVKFVVILLVTFMVVAGCSKNRSEQHPKIEEGYKTINGAEIYYKRAGEGEPIIVVHGGPLLDHGYLVQYLKPLSKNHELIYYDQRLSGRSSADIDSSDVSLEIFIEDIEALREKLNLGKVHLLAHSWGGLLAMNYAIKYSDHLQSLILLSSMPASSDLWNKEQALLAQKVTKKDRDMLQEILNSDLFKNDQSKAIEKLLKISFRSEFQDSSLVDSLNFYIPDDYMSRSQKFSSLGPEISNYDLHSKLAKLNIPTLLVYGETEAAVKLSGARLDSTFQQSTLTVIDQTGHFPFIERSDVFIKGLRKFLNEN